MTVHHGTPPDTMTIVSGVVQQYACVLAHAQSPMRDPAAVAVILHAALALIAVENLPPSVRNELSGRLVQRGWWDRPGVRLARILGIVRMEEIDAIFDDLLHRIGADDASAAATIEAVAAALVETVSAADDVRRVLRVIGH